MRLNTLMLTNYIALVTVVFLITLLRCSNLESQKKPGFIFAPDKKDDEDERGYYFIDEQLPFTVATNINDLVNDILAFMEETYLRKPIEFYHNTIHMYPEGHTSEYLAKKIVEVCK